MPIGHLGQLISVIDRPPFRPAAQVRLADDAAQAGVADRVTREREQVPPGRIGCAYPGGDHPLGLGGRYLDVEGQFRAERGGQAECLGRLGEAHDAVHAVVVGEGQRGESEPDRLLDQLLGRAGAVEEAERRVGVQLGKAHCAHPACRPRYRSGLVGRALARPGR